MLRNYSIILILVLSFLSCNENSMIVDSEDEATISSQPAMNITQLHVYTDGYVYYEGRKLKNQPVQILDENMNPYNTSKTHVVYTDANGYYNMMVCGFGLGTRYMTSTYNGKTATKKFFIPTERDDIITIRKNLVISPWIRIVSDR